MVRDDNGSRARWHIDKGIPVAVIVGMVAQFAGFVFWVGSVSRQVTDLERRTVALEAQKVGERLATVEVLVAETKARVVDMNRNLEMVVQRQMTAHSARQQEQR